MNEKIQKIKTVASEKFGTISKKADAIPFFKGNMKRKLIALGGVVILVILALSVIFGGSDDVRGAKMLNIACKSFLEEKVGKDGLKSYEFEELKWSDNRAILKANVYIKTEPSIVNPADEGMDVRGTVVFYLEADGDDVNVVNMEIR